MTTLVNPETGELVEALSRDEAERLTTRIALKLDAMADTYAGVMPLIREAIERQAYSALGYRSVGEYVADRFGGSLAKLGMEIRREVVRELTEAGMSTRAIAPVVGVSKSQVAADIQVSSTGHLTQTPAPRSEGEAVAERDNAPQGEGDGEAPDPMPEVPTPRPAVIGIDGKTYTRPEPVAKPATDPEYDNAAQACLGLTRAMSRLLTFEHPNMRAGMRRYWSLASAEVPPVQRQDVTPELMRAAARGLLELADEWESQ